MTNEQEQKIKAMAAQEMGQAQSINSCGTSQLMATPLRERLRRNLAYAKDQNRKMEMMHELEYLLDKHPEVARILELLEEVK